MVVASQRRPWQRGHVRHVTSTSRLTLTSPLATSRERGGCGEQPLAVDAAKEAGVRWVLRRRPNGIVSLAREGKERKGRREKGNFVIYYLSRSLALCVGMLMCFTFNIIISLSLSLVSTPQGSGSLARWLLGELIIIGSFCLFWLPTGYGYN